MIPVTLNLTNSLAVRANNAIDQALLYGAPGQSTPTGEVGFIAAVVLGAVPRIAKEWKKILIPNRYSVRLTGVFCHQTPRASFTDRNGNGVACELADLLVVVDDLTSGMPSTRRAVLVQAKMAKHGGGKKLSSPRDLVQLDLYTNWPPFTLPSAFHPGPRDFRNGPGTGSFLTCGRYGLIEPQPTPKWRQNAPAAAMSAGGDELGTYLAQMIQSGTHSYGRIAPGSGDDWSLTVSELLNVTGSLAFSYATGFQGRRPRKNSQVAFSVSGGIHSAAHIHFRDKPLPTGGQPGDPSYEENGEGQGISVIHIGVERADGGSR